MYEAMLRRETNRRRGDRVPIPAQTLELLEFGRPKRRARLQMLSGPAEIDRAAAILAAADRIRYLTPRLHAEMFAELRLPGDSIAGSGIDVRSLELEPADLVMLDILRRPEVMANLAEWDAGTALGDDTYGRVTASSALGVISVPGQSLTDYARGGSAVESVWIKRNSMGLPSNRFHRRFSMRTTMRNSANSHLLSPGTCAICNTISASWPTPRQTNRRCWYSGLVALRDRRFPAGGADYIEFRHRLG